MVLIVKLIPIPDFMTSDFSRLKEQAVSWQQKKADMQNDENLRRLELEELMRVDGLLQESSRVEEERKLQENAVPEEIISSKNAIYQKGRFNRGAAHSLTILCTLAVISIDFGEGNMKWCIWQ